MPVGRAAEPWQAAASTIESMFWADRFAEAATLAEVVIQTATGPAVPLAGRTFRSTRRCLPRRCTPGFPRCPDCAG